MTRHCPPATDPRSGIRPGGRAAPLIYCPAAVGVAGWREEVRKAGFRVDSSMFFFLYSSEKKWRRGGESKGQDVLWRKRRKNEGGKGNARKGGEWQWVSKTETLQPPTRARVEGGGWVGQRSLKVTGAGAVDGIDRTIWREESRCGFQSRRHEREIIPSSTPHHRTACRCRTHFYSPVRLWGRGGAEPKRRPFLPKGLFDSPFSSSAAPSQVPPLHSADRDRWSPIPNRTEMHRWVSLVGKCRLPPPPRLRPATLPACCWGGGWGGWLVGGWLFCGENQLIWNVQHWDLGGLDLNGPRRPGLIV